MIEGFVDPFAENFQNPETLDGHFENVDIAQEEEYEKATRANNKPIISVDDKYYQDNKIVESEDIDIVYQEDTEIDLEFSKKFKEEFQDDVKSEDRKSALDDLVLDVEPTANLDTSNNKGESEPEEDELDQLSNGSDLVEGFNSSMIKLHFDNKLLLKCILYGLIFYILANPRSYKYTNMVATNKLDRVLVHGIIFTLLVYVIEQVV